MIRNHNTEGGSNLAKVFHLCKWLVSPRREAAPEFSRGFKPTGRSEDIPPSRERRLNSIVARATGKKNHGRRGLKPCHYPQFSRNECSHSQPADAGGRIEPGVERQRNPRYDQDLSHKPAERATAIGPISMMMKCRMT